MIEEPFLTHPLARGLQPDDRLDGEPTLRARVESARFVGQRFIITWEAHQQRLRELRRRGVDPGGAYRLLADERQWSEAMPGVRSIPISHAQIGMTLDTYSHVTPTMQREAVRTRNAALQT